jgi:hypothetical protein
MGKIQRDAAAKALGLTPDKLQAALKGGESLADVAKAQKVSVDFSSGSWSPPPRVSLPPQ